MIIFFRSYDIISDGFTTQLRPGKLCEPTSADPHKWCVEGERKTPPYPIGIIKTCPLTDTQELSSIRGQFID